VSIAILLKRLAIFSTFEMGNGLSQIFPPRPHWTAENMPDLRGKVACVTGGYAGIGYETSKAGSQVVTV